MAANDSDKNAGVLGDLPRLLFSVPGLTLIAAVTSLFLGSFQYLNFRPDTGPLPSESFQPLSYESRSWEDPFRGLASESKAFTNASEFAGASETILRSIAERLTKAETNAPTAIIAVVVNGSAYSHGIEMRVRARFAVQSALRAAGFVREDTTHVRYFGVSFSPSMLKDDWKDATVATGSQTSQVLVPYEWFCTDQALPKTSQYQNVLVLWIREPDLLPSPFRQCAVLLSAIFAHAEVLPSAAFTIIGPRTSGGLQALVSDRKFLALPEGPAASKGLQLGLEVLTKCEIKSVSATAPDPYIIEACDRAETSGLGERDCIRKAIGESLSTVKFRHFGATDIEYCLKLIAELELREVNVLTDTIVLVSEYDTYYGRQLPLTFKALVAALTDYSQSSKEDRASLIMSLLQPSSSDKFSAFLGIFDKRLSELRSKDSDRTPNIWHYSYLAGVDGTETGTRKSEAKEERGKGGNEPETAEGDQQLDYVRRLAQEFSGNFISWSGDVNNLNKIRAVGLLGSDFYDKLLLLQALRNSMPSALFFTTDLDARMNLRSEYRWTRNLITASGFGLRVPTNIATVRLAPFRDGYQTATFLGCLDFLDPKLKVPGSELASYEVGRTSLHRLPEQTAVNWIPDARWIFDLEALKNRINAFPTLLVRAPALAIGLIGFLVLAVSTLPGVYQKGWLRIGAGWAFWLLACVLMGWVIFRGQLEPVEVGEGISVASSVILLLMAATVAIAGLFEFDKLDRKLKEPTKTLSCVFALLAMIIITGLLAYYVRLPFRGDSTALKILFGGAWIFSGILAVCTAAFWRFFIKQAVELGKKLEKEGVDKVVSDAHLLAAQTQSASKLHFYPMITILLLILASNPWIDAWHWTPWMLLWIVGQMVFVLAYPLGLHHLTSALRDEMNARLLDNAVKTDPPSVPHILQASVDRLDYGCFAPISRQPFIGALASAVGGSSIAGLLQPLMMRFG